MVACCAALVLLLTVGCGDKSSAPPSPPQQSDAGPDQASGNDDRDLMVAMQALARNDLAAAESAARRHLVKHPDDARAMEMSGDILARLQKSELAVEMYRGALQQTPTPTELLLDKLTLQLIAAGRAFDALEVLKDRIKGYPGSTQAHSEFVGLTALLGVAEQAIPSMRWLMQHGQGDPETLLALANTRRMEPDPEFCRSMLQRCDTDARCEFSLAKLDAQKMNWSAAAERLRAVRKRHPDFVPAFTLYGRTLAEQSEFEELAQWQTEAPEGVESDSEYWLVAGMWAQHRGAYRQAARAFWESARVDPMGSPPGGLQQWLVSLRQIGDAEAAEKVEDYLNSLSAIQDALVTHLERSSRSQRAAMRIAKAMKRAGRRWEAEGWARLAVTLPDEPLEDPRTSYREIRSGMTVESPWQDPATIPARQIDLSSLPQIDWRAASTAKIANVDTTVGTIAFRDEAKKRGWIHTCEVAPEVEKEGHWIYQTVGGGVGVIDFDLDGWPDLAAAMLDGEPLKSNSSPNRLFRNLDGRFSDSTTASSYSDRGFAQGITIGDYNDDGFPDLFDANIGQNRLFRNNGDGTFTEVSSDVGLEGLKWTTSAVLADIDGDGVTDLFEVSYCGGRDPYEVECRNPRGRGSCPPLKFEPEKDRVWRGRGDGGFEEVTDQWMNQATPGRALGVVAGMFDERPGIDLYVANDMTANHLWSSNTANESFDLLELATLRGLGGSARSRSQASMGMAAGDADGDGDIDFFLTHFSDDHNTYYEQVAPGSWVDRSYQVGLAAPSIKLLGFGTEWVDVDNNGTLELVVANGHVDDLVERNDVAYRMPPQLFRRSDGGEWTEVDREQLGSYFQSDHLGRALATIDADRDGRVDIAITHLYEPVSLLINATEDSGRSVRVQLKGTSGARDAIGATVDGSVAGRSVTAQLFAGDGYMCSNERCVTIGCGASPQIEELKVTWPSGNVEHFGTLTAGQNYLLVEGSGEPHTLSLAP